MVFAVIASLIALGSVLGVLTRLRRITNLELPSFQTLLARLRTREAESVLDARGGLDEALLDVDYATRSGAELPRALSRLALTSGTACAVCAILNDVSTPDWLAIVAAFSAGVAGALVTSMIGRQAEQRARQVREHWSAVARQAFRALERAED